MSAPRLYRIYKDSPGGQIHCRVAQPADAKLPPLLCLHMSPKSGWVFEPLLERLGHNRLVVAPDTPGFGMSDAPPEAPTLGYYTDMLAAVAQDFAPEQAWDLLGYHTGDLIATDMALRYPAQVSRLVLLSAPLINGAEKAEFAQLGLGRPRVWDESGDALLALWKLVLRWKIPGGQLLVAARSLADTLIAGDNGWWGHQAAFGFDFEAAVTKLTHPFAVINLGDDLYELSKRIQTLRPDARYIEKPDWAHGFIQEFPDEAAETIAAFIA